MEYNLLNETLRMLDQREQSAAEISSACGVSVRWLAYLQNGHGSDYSVSKVQRVHDYLSVCAKEQAA